MKIAYVTETWKPSVDGVVTRLENTLLHLGRMGHETLVVAPNARGLAPEPGVVTTPSVGLPFLAAGKPWGLPLTRRVTAAVREFEPDLVHVINPFVLGLAGVKAARALDLPLVASFHQDIAAVAAHYHVGFVAPFVWKHVRRQHATASRNLVTSRAMGTLLEAHGIERVALWPYGVDLDRFHPRRRSAAARRALVGTDNNVVAIYVGRLAPEKDLHHLVALAHA
ncbi:MAG TPA: glycosyltransferase, partial [Acidimicrobiales bacterium]|nr:glycosyltransferase [Acidimicrobiales bacterium]